MRIPAGDLAPARRRRYGGSYGRRRHLRNVRLVVAFVLLLVAAGAAYLLRQDDSHVPTRRATTHACATTAPAPTTTRQVRLVLLNGTPRPGLAKKLGAALAARGFVVTAEANAPAALVGPSQVVWGPGAQPAARLVVRHVLGSRAVSNPRARRGSVQVVLGSEFHRLATTAEVAAAGGTLPAGGATPAPTNSACAS